VVTFGVPAIEQFIASYFCTDLFRLGANVALLNLQALHYAVRPLALGLCWSNSHFRKA